MLTMQAFYDQLLAASESPKVQLHALEQLTRASLTEISAVKSDLLWEVWHAENPGG